MVEYTHTEMAKALLTAVDQFVDDFFIENALANRNSIKTRVPLDIHLGGIVFSMCRSIYASDRNTTTINVAESWWDALKLRHFPRWALKRWPARIKRIQFQTKVLYPDLEVNYPTKKIVVHHWKPHEPFKDTETSNYTWELPYDKRHTGMTGWIEDT